MQQLATALKYRDNGLQSFCLPSGSKRPSGPWKRFTERPNTTQQLHDMFTRDSNIAVVCGQISGNLVVLDFDSMAAFRRYQRMMAPLLNDALVVKTARGVHVWVRLPFVPRTSKPYPDIDIKGEGGYVVAPRSLHPTGAQYTFWDEFVNPPVIDPSLLPFEVLEYGAAPAKAKKEKAQSHIYIEAPRPYGIPSRLWRGLRGELDSSRYASRSEQEMALVTNCVKDGWSWDEVEALFLMHAVLGTKFRDKCVNPEKASAWLYSAYNASQEYLAANRRQIDIEIERFASLAYFEGRTRHTDEAVFHAIIEIARRAGKVSRIGASVREVAELAGIQRCTAKRSIHRIPWIQRETKSEEDVSASYSLILPRDNDQDTGKGLALFGTTRSGDIWTCHGLGRTGRLVYHALGVEARSASQVIEATRLSRRTAYRKLAALEALGAALAVPGGWVQGPLDEDAAAKALGVDGVLERRKKQHIEDRKKYQAHLRRKRDGAQASQL